MRNLAKLMKRIKQRFHKGPSGMSAKCEKYTQTGFQLSILQTSFLRSGHINTKSKIYETWTSILFNEEHPRYNQLLFCPNVIIYESLDTNTWESKESDC